MSWEEGLAGCANRRAALLQMEPWTGKGVEPSKSRACPMMQYIVVGPRAQGERETFLVVCSLGNGARVTGDEDRPAETAAKQLCELPRLGSVGCHVVRVDLHLSVVGRNGEGLAGLAFDGVAEHGFSPQRRSKLRG